MHAHILGNGQVVVHAHPYNKSQDAAPFKKHHHSATEFIQLSQLQLLFFVSLFVAVLTAFSQPVQFGCEQSRYNQLFYSRQQGRSPPFVKSDT